jgi:hypothetical protein
VYIPKGVNSTGPMLPALLYRLSPSDFAVNIVFQRLIPDLVVLCHGDDDFSLGVSFFKISDSFSRFT